MRCPPVRRRCSSGCASGRRSITAGLRRSTTCACTATRTRNCISPRTRRPCRSSHGSPNRRWSRRRSTPRCGSSRTSRGSMRAHRLRRARRRGRAHAVVGTGAGSGPRRRRGRRAFGALANGAKVERRDYRQTGVVANFKASLPHRETAYQWFHEGEIVALLPLPDGHVSLVWSAHTAHADELLALDPAQLAAEVERMSHGQAGTLDCVTPAAGFAGAADGRQADRTARRARRRCRAPDPPARGQG